MRALFVPPRPTLHISAATAQLPAAHATGKARPPPRRKVPVFKRPPTAMGAPPGGFVASLDPTIPPSTQDVDEEEAKEGDDLENAEV
jgi:hypothetical protein